MTTPRITHVRRVFDDGVITSTKYARSADAIAAGVFNPLGKRSALQVYVDQKTGNKSQSTGEQAIDIEVTDQMITTSGKGSTFQETIHTFLWGDSWASADPSWGKQENEVAAGILSDIAGGSDTDPDRVMNTKLLLLDSRDTESGVPVLVIERLAATRGVGYAYQGIVRNFVNTAANQSRKQKAKRIISTWPDNSKDNRHFIDAMVIDNFSHLSGTGPQYQATINELFNTDYYNLPNIVEVDPNDPPGDSGVDPPWMLDPLQRIVNVWIAPRFFYSLTGSNNYQTVQSPLVLLGTGDEGNDACFVMDQISVEFFTQFFTTFGSWHMEVTSVGTNGPGPSCSISPSGGSQTQWQYRSSALGGPGYSAGVEEPLSGGTIRKLKRSGDEFFVIGTLLAPIGIYAAFIDGPHNICVTSSVDPSTSSPRAPPGAEFFSRLGGIDNAPSSQSRIGGGGVSVSGGSFLYKGIKFKAIGLVADLTSGRSMPTHEIYCVIDTSQ